MLKWKLMILLISCLCACDQESAGNAEYPDNSSKRQKQGPVDELQNTDEDHTSNSETSFLQKSEPVPPCVEWDFSEHRAVETLKRDNIEIRIDCDQLKSYLSFGDATAKNYLEKLVPDTLDQIERYAFEIKNLDQKPQVIVLGDYAMRSFGSGKWNIPLSSNEDRVQHFVKREEALQDLEMELFNGELYLTTGTWGARASSDVVFGTWQDSDLDTAARKLKEIKAQLLEQKDKIEVVSLPLSTNQTKTLYNLEFNSSEKVLQVPYEAQSRYLVYYLENVVPKIHEFTQAFGDYRANNMALQLKLDVVDFAPRSIANELANGSYDRKPEGAFLHGLTILNRLLAIKSDFVRVVEKHNVHRIWFSKTKSRGYARHQLKNGTLHVTVGHEDLFETEIVDMSKLSECLQKITSDGASQDWEICRAQW